MNAQQAYELAKWELRSRLDSSEHENIVYTSPEYTVKYLASFPSAIKEYDINLFNSEDPVLCYKISNVLTENIPRLEKFIITDPESACKYAEDRMGKNPWHKIQEYQETIFDTMKKNAYWAVRYCKSCMDKIPYSDFNRSDIEDTFRDFPIDSAEYSYSVLKKTWKAVGKPHFEEMIFDNPKAAYYYCYMHNIKAPIEYQQKIVSERYYGYLYEKYVMGMHSDTANAVSGTH